MPQLFKVFSKSSLCLALKPIVIFALFSLALFSLSRFLLMAWLFERVDATNGFLFIMAQGVRFDVVLLSILLLLPLMLTLLFQLNGVTAKIWKPILFVLLLLTFALFIFVEASTPSFINQYDLRPNIWFIEYLKYPEEVFSTLYKAYKLQLVIAFILTSGGAYLLHRFIKRPMQESPVIYWPLAFIFAPIIFFLCILGGRSTLDHRAVNPSTVAFSSDPLINTLPLSSVYSVLYAASLLTDEQKDLRPYGDMPDEDVIAEVKKSMGVSADLFTSKTLPTLHTHHATTQFKKPKNIVIILVESLGAEFVGKLGGLPLTPYIDALADEGLWFDRLYATGTRSVRGIEAVMSGFLPTTARSVVKQAKSQNGFFTIASALKSKGYQTSFIYGGEGQFDNMASFFSGNGVETIIDQNDYVDPVFYGSWGVPDEDLFKKADEIFTQQSLEGPFFSLVFTASNHSPYDFPAGRIEPYESPLATRNNAAKYTDFTIGEFIKTAKNSVYWDNTIFLIIADHNSRVYGAKLVPINGFHIPALILGKDIKAKTDSRIASQIDMLPTLLSLAGVNVGIPSIGIDLTRTDLTSIPGRAIMQYAGNQAYMEGDKVVIFSEGKDPRHFQYKDDELTKLGDIDLSLEKKALAHSIWPTMAYQQLLYLMPDE